MCYIHCLKKKGAPNPWQQLCQILTDFQNSCISEKRRKFPKQRLEKISSHLIYVATLPWEGKVQNYRNELCKSYDIDTNETFIVTRMNDKPLKPLLSQHLFKVSTLRPHQA